MLLLCSTQYQLETSPPQWPIILVAGIAGMGVLRTYLHLQADHILRQTLILCSINVELSLLFNRFPWFIDRFSTWCNIPVHRFFLLSYVQKTKFFIILQPMAKVRILRNS